eukprot:CAMPEP_0180105364 /NCGR_PEP_ID=MMETSP0985-20121206/32034_1 /TAXON_ID=483367 /ORGANISM="non described non described, Strain CCMP 2436" /LENGTH=72 /DNA_ID=CAMNT_0022042445 /DNA_START=74 /DNA_END=288 /DNA_ORIENTATION=+
MASCNRAQSVRTQRICSSAFFSSAGACTFGRRINPLSKSTTTSSSERVPTASTSARSQPIKKGWAHSLSKVR